MLFTPRFYAHAEERVAFFQGTPSLPEAQGFLGKRLSSLVCEGTLPCREIVFLEDIPTELCERIGDALVAGEEAYAIEIGAPTRIYAKTRRARLYAVETLHALCEDGACFAGLLFDAPDRAVRGYKLFLPSMDTLGDFEAALDFLVEYKYNCVMLEIGGAMEYRRHPEINEEWVRYAAEMRAESRKSQKIQHMYLDRPQPWCKNSIHSDNGNGGYLKQSEMQTIIDMCRDRELEIVPEVPLMSHADYIVRAHRELNERAEDEYPDTYCPSNPRTYEIVFDILDEVIEVFSPKLINIGHDELYTAGKCPLCRASGKAAYELYAEDITRLRDYLAARGVRTMMWSEKLLAHTFEDGTPGAGSAYPAYDRPEFFPCAELLPRDVVMLNWYWSIFSAEQESTYRALGYPMLYGNYSASSHKNYRDRMTDGACLGGFVSNWGSLSEPYMQRNSQYFTLAFTAAAFWSADYDTDERQRLLSKVAHELHRRYNRRFLGKPTVELCHTTDFVRRKDYPFYDGIFIVDAEWRLGEYVLTYADGSEVRVPACFGHNISHDRLLTEREEQADVSEGDRGLYAEILGATMPHLRNGETWYTTLVEDPNPASALVSVRFEKQRDGDFSVRFTWRTHAAT